jgi:hypothetical protein
MAPSARPQTRLATGAISGLLTLALLSYPFAESVSYRAPAAVLALTAITALTFGLTSRSETAVGITLATTAANYVLFLQHTHQHLPLSTSLYAGGLLATAELAHWSLSDATIATPVESEPRHAATIAAAVLATIIAATAITLAARTITHSAPWLEPIGALAVLLIVLATAKLTPAPKPR